MTLKSKWAKQAHKLLSDKGRNLTNEDVKFLTHLFNRFRLDEYEVKEVMRNVIEDLRLDPSSRLNNKKK